MKKLFTVLCLILFSSISSFSQVVIYEIYGGGGNSGSVYKNDYVVLHNNSSTTAQSLSGWSLQNASTATSSTWKVYPLTGSIPPGGYYLIKFGGGLGGTTNLPTPDFDASTVVGTGGVTASDLDLNATNGKFALSNLSTPLTGANPTVGVIDKVGFGTSGTIPDGFEGSPFVPSPNITGNVTSITRVNNGQDTQNNSVDFSKTTPTPKNSSTPPLLVTLTYFQTEATDYQRVNIRWETAQEINSNVFILERSRNAIDYKTIAKIEAAGESNITKRYSFTDESALFGTNYYRLSQIDKDGTMQVFRPQAVIIDDASLPFGVFSNPVFQNIFNVKVEDADEANFVMNDLNGRLISLKTNKLTQTIVEITPTENLSLGMYIIQVQTLGSLKMHKVMMVK
jgi:Lamin Tail Domain